MNSFRYKLPFIHYSIENFLNPVEYKKISDFYNKLNFSLKYTDLYKFYQTDELTENKNILFFKKKVLKICKEIEKHENIHTLDESEDIMAVNLKINGSEMIRNNLDIFGSFYRADNYLLCHDDCLENRKYAFSYYLEDYETGELALYDNTATTECKRIKVTKNLLIVFKVSKISFHEVLYCVKDGRKAFTGWFHEIQSSDYKSDNQSNINVLEGINYLDSSIFDLKCLEIQVKYKDYYVKNFTLEKNRDIFYTAKTHLNLPNLKEKDIKPILYNRKLIEMEFLDFFAIIFDKKILHLNDKNLKCEKHSFKIQKGDYILINDTLNNPKNIFYFVYFYNCETIKDNLSIVNNKGDISYNIPIDNDRLYFLPRNNISLFLERTQSTFNMIIFSYFIL
ncbi:hypothetical protein CWI38_0657p0020 [Hamiltosporidium tvaerminnensis]|uniref:Prolyl 4-hydroxylase alpha subunit Fe(2+) 2OG dioxygenase domain-containing protein n=1 Tax=Hamiltosporidium tvaerminnensis TaxID=1176355 RepID=A0A4Q9LVS9_9MICR|nr:hypothetical protein CWI38_0657p0020 [Hamiltosporidium tvaerminnensis]